MRAVEIERRVRWYQRPLHEYLAKGGKRAIEVAHRRWGKDEIALWSTCDRAHERVGSYWHCLPEYAQARKALWTAVNPHTGKRRIDEAFPRSIRKDTNEQEMFIRFKNGSTWQLIGSDRYNALVGAGVAGVVFSEWALANPSSWGYIRPMVEENDGWAAFITTPRGNNHAKAMYDMARGNPRWFAEVSTIKDTGALTEEQLSEALSEYIALYGADFGRAQFDQEYYCSFAGAMVGAYWGAELNAAEREGRFTEIEIDPDSPVHTVWDLGKAVNNPIWCFQMRHGIPHIVDFYRPEVEDLAEWCKWLDDKGYNGTDYMPHDVAHGNWGSRRTRIEMLVDNGRKPHVVNPNPLSLQDGITAGRETIKVAKFHTSEDERGERVRLGIDGLKNYRREWDDDLKTFRQSPVKDWAEHIGSSWRYLGLAWRKVLEEAPPEPPKFDMSLTEPPTLDELVQEYERAQTERNW